MHSMFYWKVAARSAVTTVIVWALLSSEASRLSAAALQCMHSTTCIRHKHSSPGPSLPAALPEDENNLCCCCSFRMLCAAPLLAVLAAAAGRDWRSRLPAAALHSKLSLAVLPDRTERVADEAAFMMVR